MLCLDWIALEIVRTKFVENVLYASGGKLPPYFASVSKWETFGNSLLAIVHLAFDKKVWSILTTPHWQPDGNDELTLQFFNGIKAVRCSKASIKPESCYGFTVAASYELTILWCVTM